MTPVKKGNSHFLKCKDNQILQSKQTQFKIKKYFTAHDKSNQKQSTHKLHLNYHSSMIVPMKQFYSKNQHTNILSIKKEQKQENMVSNHYNIILLSPDDNKSQCNNLENKKVSQSMQFYKKQTQKSEQKFAQHTKDFNYFQNYHEQTSKILMLRKGSKKSLVTSQSLKQKIDFKQKSVIKKSKNKKLSIEHRFFQLPPQFFPQKQQSISSKFQIRTMINITIKNQRKIADYECQVQFESRKSFDQFINFTNVCNQSFSNIESNLEKLKIKQKQDMKSQEAKLEEHFEQFLNKVESQVRDQRQQRAFILDKDLNQAEQKLQIDFQNLQKLQNQMVDISVYKKIQYFKQISSISNCLLNLSKIILISLQKLNQKKLQRIQQRVISQIEILSQISFQEIKCIQAISQSIYPNISRLKQNIEIYKSHCHQNRVLIYNCVKKIQRLPLDSYILFGGNVQNQFSANELANQEKLKIFLSIKCSNCFQTNQKMKALRIKNDQMLPVFKSLEYLLKDPTKIKFLK